MHLHHFCWFAYSTLVSSLPKPDRVFKGKFDPSKTCNYCREKGHRKLDCPVLKNKSKHMRSPVKPSVPAAPVLSEIRDTEQKNLLTFFLLILLFLEKRRFLFKFHETGSIKKIISLKNSQSLHNLESTLGHLSPVKCQRLHSFPALFRDAPSRTDLVTHDIDVGVTKPIK